LQDPVLPEVGPRILSRKVAIFSAPNKPAVDARQTYSSSIVGRGQIGMVSQQLEKYRGDGISSILNSEKLHNFLSAKCLKEGVYLQLQFAELGIQNLRVRAP
jgi:hypothetical protein